MAADEVWMLIDPEGDTQVDILAGEAESGEDDQTDGE